MTKPWDLRGLVRGWQTSWFYLTSPWRSLPDLALAMGKPAASQRIARQQFRNLVAETHHNVVAAWCGSVLVAIFLWMVSPGVGSAVWAVASAISMGGMTVVLRRFAKAKPTDDALRRWEVTIGRMSVLAGIQWGVPAFLVSEKSTFAVPSMVLGLLLAIVGSLSLHVRYRPSVFWMTPPCAALVTLALVTRGDVPIAFVGAGFFVAVLLMVRMALLQNGLISQTLHDAEERLALLQELELRQKEAQQANQAKTRFLAAASHDLRQPIHSISLLTGALAVRPGADAEVHGQISASVQAMDDMLNGLLEVSKLDIGAAPLRLGPVSLEPLLGRLSLQFRAQAHDKGIELTVRTQAVRLHSDADQLYRLLANLVSNAVRFTRRDGKVLLRSRVRESWVWIQVWDSGVGIGREDRQRIFEEFVQVSGNETQSHHGRGIGLGLSIVQRVAQRLGHRVVLRSRSGRGSMFAVRVPLESQTAVDVTSADLPLARLLNGRLVLLIEDDAVVRQSMRVLLLSFSCHVLEADSSASALAVVDQTLRTPDLMVSDYRLADQDTGLDAITKVREAVGEVIPALLITAERLAPYEAAAGLGVPVLSKPLRAQDMERALQRLLGSTSGD